jgi:hypothetical protein
MALLLAMAAQVALEVLGETRLVSKGGWGLLLARMVVCGALGTQRHFTKAGPELVLLSPGNFFQA